MELCQLDILEEENMPFSLTRIPFSTYFSYIFPHTLL